MKTSEIKKLIESFYAGQTSQSEELLLFNYFNNEGVATELIDEKKHFLQLYEADPVAVPESLGRNLEALIDQLAEKEVKKKPSTRRVVFWSSVAASIAIVISAGIYVNNLSIKSDESLFADKQEKSSSLAITDAEYMEAENAMRLLSYNFNKGMQQIDEMHESLEKTNKILNETFKNN